MHPSYGVGHAAVTGACLTVLRSFFYHSPGLPITDEDRVTQPFAFVPTGNWQAVHNIIDELDVEALTVERILNKSCSNISIDRSQAGVHLFTGCSESSDLGEQVPIGIIEELMFAENFSKILFLFLMERYIALTANGVQATTPFQYVGYTPNDRTE